MTQQLKDWIRVKYEEIEDMDSLEHFIGTHVGYTCVDDITFMELSQPAHLEKIFKFFSLTDNTVKHPRTPMPADYDLGELRRMDEAAEKTSPRCDTTIYRRALGLLIYSLRTRPDIAFAVNHMARRATTCSEDDFIGLKRIARYLHGTRHKTLRFKCSSPEDRHAYTRLYAWLPLTDR